MSASPRWLWVFVLSFVFIAAGAAEQRVQPSGIAGHWYPQDAEQLGRILDLALKQAAAKGGAVDGRVRALILPHAGYQYSGETAAAGFRLIQGYAVKRVIVLGPAHRGGFRGLSIPDADAYETPLGQIPMDTQAIARLRESPLVTADAAAHRFEHSVEIELPFLQRVLEPGWRLVPVLVGEMEEGDHKAAADLLRPLADESSLVIVSSDFTHYGPRYGYLPFPTDGDTPRRLNDLDLGAVARIRELDAAGLAEYRRETGLTACGIDPMRILLRMVPETTRVELVDYTTSGGLTGDFRNSVSYLALAFVSDLPFSSQASAGSPQTADRVLSAEEMALLHRIARLTLEAGVGRDENAKERLRSLLGDLPPSLKELGGAFVTLRNQGRLRGCVGFTLPVVPLYEAVIRNSLNAARDRRFRPVAGDELDQLDVEVNVLTPPRPLGSYRDFEVGKQGIILNKDGHSAVFLPEVPVVAGWDREETLNELAKKAGLPEHAWQEGAELQVFLTQVYQAPLNGGASAGAD